MAATKYPYAAGKDPTYDAWAAKYKFESQNARDDAKLRRRQADEAYRAALRDLSEQEREGKRSINTSMLARGVFRSGETGRRQADLSADVLDSRNSAQTLRSNTLGQVGSDLQRALQSLALENESQINAAILRARGGGSGGGGGGGPRSSPAPTSGMGATPRPQVPVQWTVDPMTGVATYRPSSPHANRPTAGSGLPTVGRW